MSNNYMVLVADNCDLDLTLKELDLTYKEAAKKANELAKEFETVIVCEHGKFQRY